MQGWEFLGRNISGVFRMGGMGERCIELCCLLWLVGERLRWRFGCPFRRPLRAVFLVDDLVVLRASGPVCLAICCTDPPLGL